MNPSNSKSAKEALMTEHFTQDPRVLQCLQELEEFKKTKPFVVSDVIDAQGNQYVNLVQKGGGVLGVALVGYTYVLEQAGIRFLRLAGTSAGAINTALMTIIKNKQDTKSEEILKIICDLNFFNLVDGHPAARWVIKNFITNENFTKKIKFWIFAILGLFGLLIVSDITLLGLENHYPNLYRVTVLSFVLTGFYLVFLSVILFYISNLFTRLKNAGFGINPGDYFYDWLKKNMRDKGVFTVTDLKAKASQKVPGLQLRDHREEASDDLVGDVTFITSELVTQNKIQFPEMCDLFKSKAEIDKLQPAGFVRASMSIPVFFESYFINNIPVDDPDVKAAWMHRFGIENPPPSTRFVDGGMLSNFPINIFFNPKVTTPRLPSFGIDLDDSSPEDQSNDAADWTLGGYMGRMFNTIRYYYDKDFLLKNKIFEKGIGKVRLPEFNWLNFFMKDQDKIEMFVRGAQAATEFLKTFDWEEYKDSREKFKAQMDEKNNAVFGGSLKP